MNLERISDKAKRLSKPFFLLVLFCISKYPVHFYTCILISLISALLEFTALYFLSSAIASAFTGNLSSISQIAIPVLAAAATSTSEVIYFNSIHKLCRKTAQEICTSIENLIATATSDQRKNYFVKLNWRGSKAAYDTLKLAFRILVPFFFVIACCLVLLYLKPLIFLGISACSLLLLILLSNHLIGRNTTRKVRFQSMVIQRNGELKNNQKFTHSFSSLIDIAVIPERSQTASNIFYQQMLTSALLVGLLIGADNIKDDSFVAITSLFFVRQFIINIRTIVLFLRQYAEDVHLLGSSMLCIFPNAEMNDLSVLLAQQSVTAEEDI